MPVSLVGYLASKRRVTAIKPGRVGNVFLVQRHFDLKIFAVVNPECRCTPKHVCPPCLALPLADKLQKMIGFRNMVVHEYQRINIDIVVAVIETGLDDLIEFCDIILSLHKNILPNI